MGGLENGNFWEENNEELLFQEEQKSSDNAMDFLGNEESLPVINEYQEKLKIQNENTTDLVGRNISKSRGGQY